MGIFDFFKRKKEIEKSKIKLENLLDYLNIKKEEFNKKEIGLISNIKNNLNSLIQELETKIQILENFDFSKKKVEKRIELIVRENLNYYIYYTKRLIEKIRDLISSEEKDYIKAINIIFSDFEKKSSLSYQKATYLIGKEIEAIKDANASFFKNLDKLIAENKEMIETFNLIKSSDLYLKDILSIESQLSMINDNIKDLDIKSSNSQTSINNINQDMETIKKSKEFIEEENKKQESLEEKKHLEREISSLRSKVDLKSLANIFHSSERIMKAINSYKASFREQLEKNNGEDLLEIIKESERDSLKKEIDNILEIMKRIRFLKNSDIYPQNKKINEKFSEIKKLNLEISSINEEKVKENKRIEKLNENKNKVLSSLKSTLEKMNIELE